MKSLLQIIREADDDLLDGPEEPQDDSSLDSEDNDKDKGKEERGKIRYTIWETPEKKVTTLKSNKDYYKIEYKLRNKEDKLFIHFLLGFDEKDKSWKLWMGKIGYTNYDDEPYCSLKTDDFKTAILKASEETEKLIGKIYQDPEEYARFFKK